MFTNSCFRLVVNLFENGPYEMKNWSTQTAFWTSTGETGHITHLARRQEANGEEATSQIDVDRGGIAPIWERNAGCGPDGIQTHYGFESPLRVWRRPGRDLSFYVGAPTGVRMVS
jgi:hypothetical protein